MFKNQLGSIPFIVIFLVAITFGATSIIIKNGILLGPQPTTDKGFEGSISAQLKPKNPSSKQTTLLNNVKKASPTPSSSPNTTSSPTPSTTTSNSNTPSTSSPTSSPTPLPTPTPTPTPTPAPLKTYTYSGNNINTTTKCATGDSTFDIEVSGDVKAASSSDGVWTTLTGNGQTIIVSYNQGNYPSTTHISYNFNDQVSSIRTGGPITLQTSVPQTYEYEIKAYSAPSNLGTPSLSNQIGNVTFATDCK